jgi:capsular polysaccharide export protein
MSAIDSAKVRPSPRLTRRVDESRPGGEASRAVGTLHVRAMPPGVRLFFYRFSIIRLHLMASFFEQHESPPSRVVVDSLSDALSKGIGRNSILFFWGKKRNEELITWARSNNVEVRFVEDGFIRSLGLGSALYKPMSITMDRQGNYFDPTESSDLECILQNQNFTDSELQKADSLIKLIVETGVSKYNHQLDDASFTISALPNQRIILVPGQVDDDMSVIFGAPGMDNLKLLQEVRFRNPEAYIVYKPHPDVLSKNRKGAICNKTLLQYANLLVPNVSISIVLGQIAEVHTMTSLVGFEALFRGLRVVTYGMPFYAGWGLTTDICRCERRTRRLSLHQLVAGALMCYPLYSNPKTGKIIDVFEAVILLSDEKAVLKADYLKRLRMRIIGWILPRCRHLIKTMTGKHLLR